MLTRVSDDPVVANARWYARFLRGEDVASVTYRNHTLRLLDRTRQIIASITINEICNVSLTLGVFSNELTVTTKDRVSWRCRALRKNESREVRQAIIEHQHMIAAEPLARELAQQIKVAYEGIADLLSGKKYVRRSAVETLTLLPDVKRLIGRCDRYVRLCFNEVTTAALEYLSGLVGGKMQEARLNANRQFVQRTAELVKSATKDFLPIMTDEQATSVATDEDVTLVLAGAGTGKTR